jgi:RNA polymerase sigma factor (sigma-70 family)
MSNEDIIQRIQQGERTQENLTLLWTSNSGLTHKVLNRYRGLADLEDLQQEAFLALVKAVKYFDMAAGYKFTTFYPLVLQQHISRYLQQSALVIVPQDIRKLKARYNKSLAELSQELKREPTRREVAEYMNVSLEELEDMLFKTAEPSSLDAPVSNADDDVILQDTLKADYSLENDITDNLYHNELKTQIWGILARNLSEREYYIIEQYFKNDKTLADIAQELDLSSERVRQIENASFQKLRRSKAGRELERLCEESNSMLFRGSCQTFKQTGSSIVERVALKILAIQNYEPIIRR